jgi:spore maturation protein CgeB
MKILYAGVQFENYNRNRRHSFEYENFFKMFQGMPGVTIIEHPFDRIIEIGKQRYNGELLEIVVREKPDLFFTFMYTDELDPATLTKIKNETSTKSVAWFADDYWRFFNYSKHWPPYFSYVVTTYSKAVDWYRGAGFSNVLLSQWACDTRRYKPVEVSKDIDVSFVGQKKSGRAKVVEALRAAGINVDCFGFGWSANAKSSGGKISQEDMLKIFSRSKICLNLTDRKSIWDPPVLARIFLKKSIDHVIPDVHLIDNFKAWQHFSIPHTHARPFELAGCGSFVISGWSEDIGNYYAPDKEMVFYRNTGGLIEKIKYFLNHDAEREAIARAGFLRTINEHTYEARFKKIFSEIGLS